MSASLPSRGTRRSSALLEGPQDTRTPLLLPDLALEAAVGTPDPTNRTVRPRQREPVLPFPDPEDTQLSLLPLERCNDETFTENEIIAFHEYAVEAALSILVDERASPVHRRRVLDWIAVPIVNPRHLTDILSFQAMCYAAGYADPEYLQEFILRRFASLRQIPRGPTMTPERR